MNKDQIRNRLALMYRGHSQTLCGYWITFDEHGYFQVGNLQTTSLKEAVEYLVKYGRKYD